MICAGIDAGSKAIKIVLMDCASQAVLAQGLTEQGVHQNAIAQGLLEKLLAQAGLSDDDIDFAVATGYARNLITSADTTITEITCHACGVHHVVGEAKTVIDIGGQDSKVIRLDGKGTVRDFAMNDRCAAGTGRFLELVAQRLAVQLDELGSLAAHASRPSVISSMCAVFAETEIIGLLAGGAAPQDIAAGVQSAIASRILAMSGKVESPVVFTGGVALIAGMADALAKTLGLPVTIAPQPQMTGALGAAILAGRRGKIRP